MFKIGTKVVVDKEFGEIISPLPENNEPYNVWFGPEVRLIEQKHVHPLPPTQSKHILEDSIEVCGANSCFLTITDYVLSVSL
jgi:hypothetical protein